MDDRIKKIARALCRHDGKDPDYVLTVDPFPNVKVPQWERYVMEAGRFLAAYDALQPNPLVKPIELKTAPMMR